MSYLFLNISELLDGQIIFVFLVPTLTIFEHLTSVSKKVHYLWEQSDWKASADVAKLLKDLKKELTLLVVSHDLK